jgi:hypothetical protein
MAEMAFGAFGLAVVLALVFVILAARDVPPVEED